jgi:hypothetical protein
MRIPSKRQQLLRNFEQALFHSQHQVEDQRYTFYLLIRPLLEYLKVALDGLLEPQEVESEFFLLCSDLYNSFDKSRSSIVPYVEKALPWYISKLFKRLQKEKYDLSCCIADPKQEETSIEEEFYWNNILFQDRYVGKCFTRSEKYIIYIILDSDDKNLTTTKLANRLGRKRWQMKEKLLELKEIFQQEEINVREHI